MNKFIKTLFLSGMVSIIATNVLFAKEIPVTQHRFKKVSISKTYAKGWWWYKETYKNPITKKEKVIEYKLSPAEKAKIDSQNKTNKLLQMLIKTQKRTQKLNEKILSRLIYAFPHTTPIYTINKKTKKKCLTNSSSNCFIMPVTAEGQHVPVLKKFLMNPSPENSKKWLQWQATYFNQVNNISNGLRFAFLKGGSSVYSTSTDYTYGDNLWFGKAEAAQGEREGKIIHANKNKIAYLLFLGQNKVYEQVNDTYEKLYNLNTAFMKGMKLVIVFPSKKAERYIMQGVVANFKKEGETQIAKFYEQAKKAVRPDLYKKYNIRITPTVVLFYKDKKRVLWQPILAGQVSIVRLRKATIKFLEYNKILNPGAMGADKNWNSPTNPVIKNLIKIPKLKQPINFKAEGKKLEKLEQEDKE